MSKIDRDNQQEQSKITNSEENNKSHKLPNLFEGITDPKIENTKFPNWDIVPPSAI